MLGECLDGRFGGVVSWIARGVGDSLFGACDQDGAGVRGGGMAGYEGEEGGQAVDYAEEVYVHDLLKIRSVWPGATGADSSV